MTHLKRTFAVIASILLVIGLSLFGASTVSASGYWQPTNSGPNNGPEFQWEIGHALNTASQSDMGTTAADLIGYQGKPTTVPTVYDVDAIDNPASTVATLHTAGAKAICYIEVGTAGNYYTASAEGIPTTYYAQLKAAGDLGKKLSGYPEYFININAPSAVSIVESMIQKQCAGKGFDGVETDLDETFGNNEGSTGFTITKANEQAYLITLANYMHSLGLAWVAKNLDDTGNQSFVTNMAPYAQAIISESCNYYGTCGLLTPFTSAGKPVFNAEYTDEWGSNIQADLGQFCAADIAASVDGTLFTSALGGQRNACK